MSAEYQPYSPLPAPTNPGQLGQYLDDELNRIAAAFQPRIDPALFVMLREDTIPITADAPVWGLVYDAGDVPGKVDPAAMWANGRIVAPYDGTYSVSASLNTVDPGGGGQRDYWVGLGFQRNWVSGEPVFKLINQALNSVNQVVSWDIGVVDVQAGDTLDVVAAAYADQFSIVCDIEVGITVMREA